MAVTLPDYSNCAVNLVASVMERFGVPAVHSTLPAADRLFDRECRNVILMLLDGLGEENLNAACPQGGFLRSRTVHRLSAVFPSTTTASTTSFATGLAPGEHGWLGWTLYFPQLDANVDTFSNRLQFGGGPAAGFHAASRFLPCLEVSGILNARGGVRAVSVSPFGDVTARTFDGLLAETKRLCVEPGRHYVYAYWGEPDAVMHRKGCLHPESLETIRRLEEKLESFARSLDADSLLLVTADHGLIDSPPLFFEDHPALERMLKRPPSVEPRAAALHVRQGELNGFPSAFREAFGDAFLLLTGEEAIGSGLFGPPPHHPLLPRLVGDYFAAAIDRWSLFQKHEHSRLIGMHAGLTPAEMGVPLILAR